MKVINTFLNGLKIVFKTTPDHFFTNRYLLKPARETRDVLRCMSCPMVIILHRRITRLVRNKTKPKFYAKVRPKYNVDNINMSKPRLLHMFTHLINHVIALILATYII